MKMTRNCMIVVALLAAPGNARAVEPAAAQPPGKANATYTESISDEALRALQKVKPLVAKAAPESVQAPYDIVAMSDFIAFDELSTLVPKGAILHTPEAFRHNVVRGPQGKLVLWNEFLTRNRARIAPFEITVEVATGAKPVDPKTLKAAILDNRILVAVIHGNPTSIARTVVPPPATVQR